MTNDEKRIFELLDRLEEADAERMLELLPDGSGFGPALPPSEEPDAAALARIKARTLDQLAQGDSAEAEPDAPLRTTRPGRFRRRAAILAAAAAALLVMAGIDSSPSAQAELKKVLRFLPGFGSVQEGDPAQWTYVLEKPYVQPIGSGKLTVDAVVLQPEGATITLRGVGVSEVKSFKADIGGRTVEFSSAMRASSGDWYGNYVPPRGTRLLESDTITLTVDDTVIGPLKLIPPKTADDLEHLGSSDVQQGIRVIAFPTPLENGLVRVQLVPKLPDNRLSVNSYGVKPLVKGAGLYVEDASGNMAELPRDDTMSYPSDFRFQELEGGHRPYTVVIPYLEVSDREAISGEIAIPLPPVGSSRFIDISATINGFPVSFTRVVRDSETSVGIDVDVHFDPTKPQTLQYFLIRYAVSDFNASFGWETIEKGYSTMKTLHLEVKPGQTELRFSITEPHILVKGPWRLTLNAP
jgi:hypothetical protein